jgi:hypothetical protein
MFYIMLFIIYNYNISVKQKYVVLLQISISKFTQIRIIFYIEILFRASR